MNFKVIQFQNGFELIRLTCSQFVSKIEIRPIIEFLNVVVAKSD